MSTLLWNQEKLYTGIKVLKNIILESILAQSCLYLIVGEKSSTKVASSKENSIFQKKLRHEGVSNKVIIFRKCVFFSSCPLEMVLGMWYNNGMARIPSTAQVDTLSNLDTLLNGYSVETADTWLRQVFGSYDASMRSEIELGINKNEQEYFDSAVLLGYIKELPQAPRVGTNCPVIVASVHMKHDLVGRDSRVAQFNLSKRIIKEAVAMPRPGIHGLPVQGLFFFHDDHGHFRLSLVSGNVENKRFVFNSAKRQSFFVNEGGSNPTIRRRFNTKIKTLADLKEVFSVEALTKAFYKSLFDWYLWATEKDKTITFPNDLAVESDNRDYLEPAVIRLLTRLMFIWFIKQKGLVPDELFEADKLGAYIKDFEATSKEQDNYYRVILQNLFFATLNCKPEKRKFKRIYRGMSHERGIATCYRYVDEMQNEHEFKELMAKVPFLNCALFDCLDKKEREQDGGRELYLDGFSDRKERRAHIHNAFFFDEHQGLIPLFNQYEFTVDENSATDTDVALDPELLGKVFENLLGSYNPETKETARKATGAFYTPREIVNFMVRESLKSYLRRKCAFADDARLADLFDETKTDQIMCFSNTEKKELLDAIYSCKILDPACGSGAFPMGVLHIMVRILNRLDKDNRILRGRLLEQYKADKAITIAGLTEAEQQERVEMLYKQFQENISFPDYARKLYLIENCIYGIDIQPIATQISKLRFFISLLCDQLRTAWNPEADNHGLLSLPNLEAKFVCADSLLSLPKLSGDSLAMSTANIQALKQKLESNRHLVFTARTIETKNKYKARELEIRDEIRDSIRLSLSTPDEELIATLEAQLPSLRKQLAEVAEPKIELREFTEQADLFSPPQLVIREIDVNEDSRSQIKADIANVERAIATERAKAHQSGSTELDRLALAVSGWDPYDQNACSDFFDASWMFNINDGFDIVIGNPPYFVLKKSHSRKNEYEAKYSEVKSGRTNIYQFFLAASYSLSSSSGIVSYIHPKTLFCDAYLAGTRKYLIENFGKAHLIDICDRKDTFESVLQSVVITMWEKSETEAYYCAEVHKKEDLANLSFLKVPKEELIRNKGIFLVSSNRDCYRIADRVGLLEQYSLEFVTGSIEWNKYKPKLTGQYKSGYSRLIYAANIQRFYFEEETNRDDKRFFNSDKLPTLNHISIIAQRTTSVEQKNRIFADVIDPSEYSYPLVSENNTSVCFFDSIEDALFCLGILNSTFVDFYLRLFNSNTHISSSELNRIPIPVVSSELKHRIIQQVKDIKRALVAKDGISEEFAVLDNLVYEAYRLTHEDVDFIKKRYKQTEETNYSTRILKKQSSKKAKQILSVSEDDYLD